jgi:cytochrome c1
MTELLIDALKWMAVPHHLIAISLGFVVAYFLLSITFWKKNKGLHSRICG